MQAICDPKSGCSLTQALWIQHLMITHNKLFQTINHCMIATFQWPENGFQTFTFLSSFTWRLWVFHFPSLNVFNIWCFFPDLENHYQSTTNLFWQRFQIPGMLWQPENETSWLLSDFPVNFSQPHIIAFSPLFTNRGNPVLNIEISKINVKRLLSSCWIQQIQQTWCLKYQQLPL